MMDFKYERINEYVNVQLKAKAFTNCGSKRLTESYPHCCELVS